MKGRIIHVAGTSMADITAAVQVLYDLVIDSQNYGSGFWSIEDLQPVADLAILCDFNRAGEVQKYIDDQRHYDEMRKYQTEHFPVRLDKMFIGMNMHDLLSNDPVAHEHIYSSVNRCMWPRCTHRKEENSG